ncbi:MULTISPECIES: hypothetical protein [unclassified Methylophilus]|uniref:hypothetical protein n=1 Tax=unclassified Methylophilus TaxID=2630143 RepID=UPI0007001EC6|nr:MULTISPECIES: hypothetical protein [unclassified Methylophilus]KQT43814.1 hypothetical protein ASG34_03310 [Methylophilus sp. Leaf416]KQT59298.1 hypothetical protein ASG44_03315 [Methylophilus sp. Leaf459]
MAKKTVINRLKSNAKSVVEELLPAFEKLEGEFPDAVEGLSFEDAKKTANHIGAVLKQLLENDSWDEFSWTTLNSVDSMIVNLINSYAAFKVNKNPNDFINFISHLDSVDYHLRIYHMVSSAFGSLTFERNTRTISAELDDVGTAKSEYNQLSKEVKALIAPAVAGSLSQAFTSRKTTLLYGRIVWGLIALVAGSYSITATYSFTAEIGAAILTPNKYPVTSQVLWATIAIRSIVLFPLYAAFGFSFSQYRKERDFEEEYAHKAAVATSLPNYGDLTREPAVRDQIVTGATNVIFTAPTTHNNDNNRSDVVIGSVKELFDSVAKLVPKKGE